MFNSVPNSMGPYEQQNRIWIELWITWMMIAVSFKDTSSGKWSQWPVAHYNSLNSKLNIELTFSLNCICAETFVRHTTGMFHNLICFIINLTPISSVDASSAFTLVTASVSNKSYLIWSKTIIKEVLHELFRTLYTPMITSVTYMQGLFHC